MPVTFTAAEDAAIREARASGLCWVKVGLLIHRHPGDVRRHAYEALGFTPPSKELKTDRKNVLARALVAKAKGAPLPDVQLWRLPLRAGHPVSWGAICTAAYPPYVSWAR